MIRDTLGYDILEPGCSVELKATLLNKGGMPTPSHHDVSYYLQDNDWVTHKPSDYVTLARSIPSKNETSAPTVLFHINPNNSVLPVGELSISSFVDHRAKMSRVDQEFCRVREQTTPIHIQYPVHISQVQCASAVALGEEAPFAFRVRNRSNQPIGVGAPGLYSRVLNVGVSVSFDEGSHNTKYGIQPSDIVLRDHRGTVVETLGGFFHEIEILQPEESRDVCGTIAFSNPNLATLTSLEVRANLMLGLLSDKHAPVPIQIMPFYVQKAEVREGGRGCFLSFSYFFCLFLCLLGILCVFLCVFF